MKKLLLIFGLLILTACAKVPLTDRNQLILIPRADIVTLAVDSYQEIINKEGVSGNQDYAAQLSRVGTRITGAVEQYLQKYDLSKRIENYNWEYNVLSSDQVNAFALPGGKIAFYEGIMPICQDDNGIAVVMGHEIAHAIARHGNERMSQGLMINLGGMALSEALQNKTQMTYDLAMTAFGIGAQVGIMLPYSRTHETEADELGLYFMAMAGYDPRKAPEFWRRMGEQGGQRPPEFLSTHPHPETRIDDLSRIMNKAMKYYMKSKTSG